MVHDDLDVPLWRIKIVDRGGPGGHRGILSLISQLHTEEFLRVKLGIGRPPMMMPTENYVLSHFPAPEAENVARLVERAAKAVDTLIREGRAAAQTRFHGDPECETEPGQGPKTGRSD